MNRTKRAHAIIISETSSLNEGRGSTLLRPAAMRTLVGLRRFLLSDHDLRASAQIILLAACVSTEMRIRQYKSCCIPQICYVSCVMYRLLLLRGVSAVNCQRTTKKRANSWYSWNDSHHCHSRVEVKVPGQSTASAENKMLGFCARASRISNSASGRGGPRYCGGQPSIKGPAMVRNAHLRRGRT